MPDEAPGIANLISDLANRPPWAANYGLRLDGEGHPYLHLHDSASGYDIYARKPGWTKLSIQDQAMARNFGLNVEALSASDSGRVSTNDPDFRPSCLGGERETTATTRAADPPDCPWTKPTIRPELDLGLALLPLSIVIGAACVALGIAKRRRP